jgi:hypothetical protein
MSRGIQGISSEQQKSTISSVHGLFLTLRASFLAGHIFNIGAFLNKNTKTRGNKVKYAKTHSLC